MHTATDVLADLPSGLTTRPVRADEVAIVTALFATEELANLGEVMTEEADLVSDWARSEFDITAHTLGVYDGDRLVAYAEWSGSERAEAAVLPAYHGRGIGTALEQWLRTTAAAGGARALRMPTPEGSPGDRLLAALGWHVGWMSWVLTFPAERAVPERPLPAGYDLRMATPEDREAIWTVIEDAFLEWSDRPRETLEDFATSAWERPGFQPWQLRVVTESAGAVVGAVILHLSGDCAFVAKLGVRPEHRNRGLAQALLADAFRAGREHGATRSELGTDTRTGALGLYERLGMEVTHTWVSRMIEV